MLGTRLIHDAGILPLGYTLGIEDVAVVAPLNLAAGTVTTSPSAKIGP